MAIKSAVVSVTTSATQLNAPDADSQAGESVVIYNAGASSIFLGGSAVTAAAGFPLAAAATIAITLDGGENIYAITASGTISTNVLTQGS